MNNIHILDFEQILKNFKPYHESLHKIRAHKKDFSDKIDEMKKEMETIVNSSRSLLLDDTTQTRNQNRVRELQTEGMKAESEFRSSIIDLQNNELEKNFSAISTLVEEWCKANKVDMILNKNAVVYVSSKNEITDKIESFIKEKGLYREYDEKEFQLVEEEDD